MNKNLLGIAIRDTEYAERIEKMINQLPSDEFTAVCYKESMPVQNIQYWITDGTYLFTIMEFKTPVILMADIQEAEMLVWKGERIDPYISAKRMIKQIRTCINRMSKDLQTTDHQISRQQVLQEPSVPYMNNRQGHMLSVYSPIGGCGKSTLAMTLCECIAETIPQYKTLYFNLEGTSDWPMFFRPKGEFNLSDFLYTMLLEKPDIETAGKYINDITVQQENGVFFLEPCSIFEDLNVLEENEVQQLIDVLKNNFDYIVCDLNTAFHSINKQFLLQSEARFIVSNGTLQGQCKIEKYKEGIHQQHLEQHLLSNGTYFVQIGSNGKVKNKNKEFQILPLQKEMYVEKNGLLNIRHNSEWYKKVKLIAEEVTAYART